MTMVRTTQTTNIKKKRALKITIIFVLAMSTTTAIIIMTI